MSFALIGIIAIQVFWIQNAIQANQIQFDTNVNKSLQKVVKNIKRQETFRFVSKKIEELNVDICVNDSNTTVLNWKTDTCKTIVNINSSVSYDTDLVKIHKSHHVNENMTMAKSIVVILSDNDSINDNFKNSKIELEHIIEEMAIEYDANCKNINDRLKLSELDSTLNNELINNGIDLKSEYAIINKVADTISDYHSANFQTDYSAKIYDIVLFPDDLISKSYILTVYFPNQNSYVYKSLFWLLLLSTLFTLIIIATFGLTLHTIVKQKKISQIKSDFINNMTHEFKTPIATISLATETIENSKVINNKERIVFFTKKIKEEIKRMNSHVENILQISLLDKKNFNLSCKNTDLHKLIQSTVDNYNLQVAKRNGKINTFFDAKNYNLNIDATHFTNVISNLLDNANKYSEQCPEINIYTKNTNSNLLISVEDNGIGMNKEEQNKIFEKFYRVTTGNVHNVKGFGLGLSYVKSIIQAHRGNISVKSEKGYGSRFDVYLPLST